MVNFLKKFNKIKKVLMCRPSFFEVTYKINPWMQVGSVNKNKAYQQWLNLKNIYEEYGIKVEIIDQEYGLPDMVFAADQGLPLRNNSFILSRFHYTERQGETAWYLRWLQKKGFHIFFLPENVNFEGNGDCLNPEGKYCFVGKGFRNNDNIDNILKKYLNKKIISLELINPNFYHLDTCFFVLNPNTVVYYPKAFSTRSQLRIESIFDNTYYFNPKEVENFAANSVVHGNIVFAHAGNPEFFNLLYSLGYHVMPIDISEFMKAGGGIHCLTLILGE